MKKIIVIGGGISGLTSGIFAQRAGFESVVLEKNPIPGGECTGWDRKGSYIDGCIHWLTGTKKDTELYDLWCKVGALENIEIINMDYFYAFDFDGRTIYFYNNYDKLREELISVSPTDEKIIDEFISSCKSLREMRVPVSKPMDMMNMIDMIKMGKGMMSAGMVMQKYSKITVKEFSERLKSPILQKIFKCFMPENYSVSQVMFSYATVAEGNGGIPVGGSRKMAMRVAEKYKSLGGDLRLNSDVEEIIVKDGVAVGVRMKGGEIIKGDYVISACDADVTLNKLLGGKYKDKQLQPLYDNLVDNPIQSNVFVSYAVDGDVSDIPYSFVFKAEPYAVANKTEHNVGMRVYSYDDTLISNGKTTVASFVLQTPEQFDYWKELYKDKSAYNAEKQRIANEILERIMKKFPNLKDRVEVLDVVTPVTYERYCGAYKGSWMAFMQTPKSKGMQSHNGIVDGVKNLQLSGQWVYSPGGLPCAVATGKFAVQRICKQEKMNVFI